MSVRKRVVAAALGVACSLALTTAGCGTVPVGAAGPASDLPTATPTSTTASADPSPSATPTPTPSTTPTPSADPKPAAVLAEGAKGDKVRELQHRLRQLDWYSGSITGTYGSGTVKAVDGFQAKRKLPRLGYVDQATWTALVQRTRKPTDAEMHNRLVPGPAIWKQGSTGDKVRELQARLKQIGWFAGTITPSYGPATVSGVRGFQAKREIPVTGEVDQRTWSRLVGMTRTPSYAEKHNQMSTGGATTAGLDSRCLTGRAVCVSKSSNSLTWVVDGKAKLRMEVRFGSQELPTREGSFRIFRKDRDAVSTIYHTSMPFAMLFSGGQAVHYSPDFAYRGYNGASHGCVNVRNYTGMRWLFDQARIGDKVIVYR